MNIPSANVISGRHELSDSRNVHEAGRSNYSVKIATPTPVNSERAGSYARDLAESFNHKKSFRSHMVFDFHPEEA